MTAFIQEYKVYSYQSLVYMPIVHVLLWSAQMVIEYPVLLEIK